MLAQLVQPKPVRMVVKFALPTPVLQIVALQPAEIGVYAQTITKQELVQTFAQQPQNQNVVAGVAVHGALA